MLILTHVKTITHLMAIAVLINAIMVTVSGEEPKLIFKSGFEGAVHIQKGKWLNPDSNREQILGTDDESGYNWRTDWEPYLVNAHFEYVISSDKPAGDFVTTAIRQMPGPVKTSPENRILYLGVKGDDPQNGSTTRNELDLHPNGEFQQAYAKYWMKIHPDFYQKLPENTWVMVMEWKEPDNPQVSTGGTNNWHTNITLRSNDAGKLAWCFQRQTVQPDRITEQMVFNESVPVPVGDWFTVETFWKWGKDGRIWYAINGETIFDQFGRFEHPDNPLGLKFWAIFKNYRGLSWYDDDLSNGDETWFAYDDVEVWSDFPAGHPKRESDKDILVIEAFDSGPPERELPATWWFEGAGSGATARIKRGRLHVDADNRKGQAGTAWLDLPLAGNLEVEFDVRVESAIEESNNVNFFLFFRDPDGVPLRETRDERASGSYRLFTRDRLVGLVMTHVANGTPVNARTRLREVPPFEPPLAEFFGTDLTAGETYHIRIQVVDGHIRYFKNGRLLLEGEIKDFDHSIPGHLGFRTWQTELSWDNLIVRRISRGRD